MSLAFLNEAREQLKSRTFTPLPVRERMIPKPGQPGKFRRLGIPSAMDRLVQAALVLVLEPIFEADFKPVSYGFRPKRRAQDAIAEIHAPRLPELPLGVRGGHHGVLRRAVTSAILDRVRRAHRRQAGPGPGQSVPQGGHHVRGGQVQGTPSPARPKAASRRRCWPTSPCRRWMSISAPNGTPTAAAARREAHRKRGGATYRIVRYADDFVIMVRGTQAHADALWEEVAAVLAPLGLRLSEAKTRVCHLDEGFDFLGFRIQRRRKRGTTKQVRLHLPVEEGTAFDHGEGAGADRADHGILTLADLLRQLNPVLRGWCTYFRHGVSKATFGYLDAFAWRRVTRWLRKRHKGITWKDLYRRFLTGRPGNRPAENGVIMFDTAQVEVTRYRWRADNIPTPWTSTVAAAAAT